MIPVVYLVEDDAAVRDSLSLLLSLKGFSCQVFASAETFLETCRPDQRGCVLSDLRMPGMTGMELLRELMGRRVRLPVVLLTAHGDVATTRLAMKSGAFDFLEKPVDDEVLVDVLQNAIAFEAQQYASESEQEATRGKVERLTAREKEVMRLVAEGLQNRDIARRLGISPRTVEVYKSRMMEKLDCRSLADVLRLTSKMEEAAKAGN